MIFLTLLLGVTPMDTEAAALVALVQSMSKHLAPLPPKPKAPEWQDNLQAVLARATELADQSDGKRTDRGAELTALKASVEALKKMKDTAKARGDLLVYLGVQSERPVKCADVFAPMFFDKATGALRAPVTRLEDVPQAVDTACKPFLRLLKALG